MTKKKQPQALEPANKPFAVDYDSVFSEVVGLLEQARRTSARVVNAIMTATYWEIGRQIVESEQGGKERAEYGKELLKRLSADLTVRFGRGFSRHNLQLMRQFYLAFPLNRICETTSSKLRSTIRETGSSKMADVIPPAASIELTTPQVWHKVSAESALEYLQAIATRFPLPWSHYVLLIRRSRSSQAMEFYHTEALRGGWSVRQLKRQIDTQFYERTALSKNKAAMLTKAARAKPGDGVSADEEIRDPLVLEFLNLKDEYSESDLEEALICHLESFLLELGNEFAFIGRQRRLRIDDEWYRVDLLFFHRRLRCLVVIDLKLGRFTHADAGQMHLYLNYAREHWVQPDENPPVGIVLCAGKSKALVHYATEGLPNKMLVREYLTALPDENLLANEIQKARKRLEERR